MEITVRQRQFIDRFRCRDSYRKIKVKGLAFKAGDLYYFRKDDFNYLVVSYDTRENVYCM